MLCCCNSFSRESRALRPLPLLVSPSSEAAEEDNEGSSLHFALLQLLRVCGSAEALRLPPVPLLLLLLLLLEECVRVLEGSTLLQLLLLLRLCP